MNRGIVPVGHHILASDFKTTSRNFIDALRLLAACRTCAVCVDTDLVHPQHHWLAIYYGSSITNLLSPLAIAREMIDLNPTTLSYCQV